MARILEPTKVKIIFECLVDLFTLDKSVEIEIPFLGLFKDFLERLIHFEKNIKFQTVIDAVSSRFIGTVIQVKEQLLGILTELFKNYHETVG